MVDLNQHGQSNPNQGNLGGRANIHRSKHSRYRDQVSKSEGFQVARTSSPNPQTQSSQVSHSSILEQVKQSPSYQNQQRTQQNLGQNSGSSIQNYQISYAAPKSNSGSNGLNRLQQQYRPTTDRFYQLSYKTNTGSAVNRSKGQGVLGKVQPYEKFIRQAAARYNLPPELIAGVILQESAGKVRARSHVGAMGLMQLMPQTAARLGVSNPWDPQQNIMGGAKYIRQMLNKFGRLDHAIAAYNAGPGNVQKYGGIPPFKETRNYVPKVLGYTRSAVNSNLFATNAVGAGPQVRA